MQDIALKFNKHVISAGNMAANLDSGTIDLSDVKGYCVQADWSGVPVGNIIIQGSNDGSVFKDLTTTAAGGAAGHIFSNNDGIHYVYLKVIYSFTSGTGVLNVYVSGKR